LETTLETTVVGEDAEADAEAETDEQKMARLMGFSGFT